MRTTGPRASLPERRFGGWSLAVAALLASPAWGREAARGAPGSGLPEVRVGFDSGGGALDVGRLASSRPPAPPVGEAAARDPGAPDSTVFQAAGSARLRVGIYRPASEPVGDVLYLHGFGDRLDNHGPLFRAWTGAGLRVVSFDFPYHGESTASGGYGIADLGSWALAVERATREDARRPLILSGWSTGGMAAVRAVQSRVFDGERPPRGLILLAPAVAPRMLVGEAGRVTARTLTRNPAPPHRGPIEPDTPFALKSLAASIVASAGLSWRPLPRDLPVLLVVAGRQDRYVKTGKALQWASARGKEGARISTVECPAAYHELDNEPEPTGGAVRSAAARFAAAVAAGTAPPEPLGSSPGDCRVLGEGVGPAGRR